MFRSAASKVMWVGRATVFLVGLAVILALVFGAASTVSAHTGNKGFFHLGHKNVSEKVSTLVKKGAGPALNLQVGSGPPLAVNSSEKVEGFNADKLDGQDSDTYLPGDLPAGKTVRGNFYVMGPATAGNQYFGEGISFGYRLPSLPTARYIKSGDPVPAGCSGDATNPEAAPGHLCVFEASSFNVNGNTFGRGVDRLSRQGSGLFMLSSGAGHTFMVGTWAVTAPTAETAAAASSRSTVAKDGPTE